MARLIWKLETYEHILGVHALDGADDSGGNHELLPGLGNVEVVDTFLGASVDVALHLLGHVLGTNVNLSQKVRQSVKNRSDDYVPQRRSSQLDPGLCYWCTRGTFCRARDAFK